MRMVKGDSKTLYALNKTWVLRCVCKASFVPYPLGYFTKRRFDERAMGATPTAAPTRESEDRSARCRPSPARRRHVVIQTTSRGSATCYQKCTPYYKAMWFIAGTLLC